MFPQLAQFTDLSLLLLRLMVAAIFVTSGWSHLRDPKGRAQSIGMSPAFTMFLGAAELDMEEGRKAAPLAALNALAVARQHLESLDRVTRVVRPGVSVATSGDVRDQPKERVEGQ
ncbi:MAG TPA: hypothetical protein VF544_16455 [Pyrinomonadaceae bacterium]|jgi:uncharacterized membrane protein YphA (DoxX/SURF4 family)